MEPTPSSVYKISKGIIAWAQGTISLAMHYEIIQESMLPCINFIEDFALLSAFLHWKGPKQA